ncbi:bifunctional folylpolyglutamate synthase/dihydrofolate synthase, partial [Elusimicrobiota bacterium]
KKVLNSISIEYFKLSKKYKLTFFEFLTSIAFKYFSDKDVDFAVIETGLGGRFDSTNIVEHPLATVITSIDYDHQDVLGEKLSQIAYEKTGIIKKGCYVISGAETNSIKKIIFNRAKNKKAKVLQIGRDFKYQFNGYDWKRKLQKLCYFGDFLKLKTHMSLLGKHQAKNCALALASIEAIVKQGYEINLNIIPSVLKKLNWPGRFDIRELNIDGKKTTIILDGAHNCSGMDSLIKTIKSSPWSNKKKTVVFGILQEKKYLNIIKKLADIVKNVVLIPFESKRKLDANILKKMWGKYLGPGNVQVAQSFIKIVKNLEKNSVIIVTGSLYMLGKIAKTIDNLEKV